jgi:hypothetical protein
MFSSDLGCKTRCKTTGKLTWNMISSEDVCICGCGHKTFFVLKETVGYNDQGDKDHSCRETFSMRCCHCGYKYPIN